MKLKSWVSSANSDSDFPIQNLPYGVFQGQGEARMGVAIGDFVLDVPKVDHGLDAGLFRHPSWNAVMAAGPEVWAALRSRLTELLSDETYRASVEPHLVPMQDVRLLMPFTVTEYTDFYAAKNHVMNVGTIFRGAENALPPNWLSIPVGYNGRASSVVVSGTEVVRPWGQVKGPDDELPRFAPSARFDLELEIGAIVGQPSQGMITVAEADEMIFGYVLLNDWSARDIQSWEYQPLGPFQSKATATTISPWIVTKAALEPFRVPAPERDRPLLPYLAELGPMFYDITLEITLTPDGGQENVISRTNASELYYSSAQQLAHHTSCGCPMRVGDLLGSGTISGPQKDSRGSMLEMSWGGKEPLVLANGDTRTFLEDGDVLTLRGAAKASDYRIGFGQCTGRIRPAAALRS
ncbi:fumarylacetoacetase [Rhizobium pusense]|uniref:fumarylacetoacetase n=1 Tax=Agrobacterium pusense TaxID=648995 RepID=UPI001FCD7D9C|nr:fumarylacetoacetase [Agrobacterium pusense]MCJ2877388.1 fumarylacetoacetase [Agrobacterium pusense]